MISNGTSAMMEISAARASDADKSATLPATSLIICSRNRPQLLAETVESVLIGDEVPAEIVIIDQSDERHPRLAMLRTDRNCELRYLWTHSAGISRGRNTGIRMAQHDILAITDDDMTA